MRGPLIGVIGAGKCSVSLTELATEVGREIARRDAVLVCGGLGGVMEAAARGAKECGGVTVGILPGPNIRDANPYIDFPVATNMGSARNAIITQTAEVFVAVGGAFGTLSEMALASKLGKVVVALSPEFQVPGLKLASTAREAVDSAFEALADLRAAAR
ncbi:MAG: TIGR00725 family protein [Syntrophobacteraceae bacterium]